MTHANETEVQALWALDSYESAFRFIADRRFAPRSKRVQRFTWDPWIMPYDGMWWGRFSYVHVVRNGLRAGNVGQDFRSFFGIAHGCGNLKKGAIQRLRFESCPTHRLGAIHAVRWNPIAGVPIGHSSARPADYTVGSMTIPASADAQLAPPPLTYGPVIL